MYAEMEHACGRDAEHSMCGRVLNENGVTHLRVRGQPGVSHTGRDWPGLSGGYPGEARS
jgi:hypothetical protein